MTSNQVRDLAADAIDEQSIATYLQHNPDFFERQPQLLARMRLLHPRNGATISLIERQVEVLRERFQAQEEKLADFVRVARSNNALAEKIHRFTRRLLRAGDRRHALAEIEASLREDFDTLHAVLVLPESVATTIGATGADSARGATGGAPADAETGRFIRSTAADDAAFRSFESLFSGGKPRCGQIRDSQREFLFGADAPGIGSVALIPLTLPSADGSMRGVLALGSVDRDRFHPDMSIEFLARMGELITDALDRP